jgi:DNA-binding LacI/PurR family transcriptional regulator
MAKMTIEEVAAVAGCSPATVSRALNSPQKVRPATRERVMRAIREHNYVYNATAGDLSRKRGGSVIGVMVPSIRANLFQSSINALHEVAQDNGFSIILGNSRYDPDTERLLLHRFQERRVAGVLLTGFSRGLEGAVAHLAACSIPSVVMWEKLDGADQSYVGFDNFKAAHSVADYLARLGHRRIGLIIGPYSRVGRVRRRYDGYLAALADHGLPHDPALVVEKEPDFPDGMEAMARLMALPDRPTAVFAASDILAAGALAGAGQAGLRVPEDVSVAGFDDMDLAAYLSPPLTTVRVPAFEIGRKAGEFLLEMIRLQSLEPRQHCFETSLVVRGSCREA